MKDLMDLWPAFVAAAAGLVWLVRLEAKFLILKSKYEDHVQSTQDKTKLLFEKFETLSKDISEIKVSVGEIKTELKHGNHE